MSIIKNKETKRLPELRGRLRSFVVGGGAEDVAEGLDDWVELLEDIASSTSSGSCFMKPSKANLKEMQEDTWILSSHQIAQILQNRSNQTKKKTPHFLSLRKPV